LENGNPLPTGRDLRAARVRYGVRADDIGRHLGLTGERVRQFERQPMPTSQTVARYLRALQALTAMGNR